MNENGGDLTRNISDEACIHGNDIIVHHMRIHLPSQTQLGMRLSQPPRTITLPSLTPLRSTLSSRVHPASCLASSSLSTLVSLALHPMAFSSAFASLHIHIAHLIVSSS